MTSSNTTPFVQSDLEIERKFLLRGMPELPADAVCIAIEQGYIPGEVIHERLRRAQTPKGERLTRTVKLGRGLSRVELQEDVSASLFALLWPATLGKRLTKQRFRVPDGTLTWEIDVFTDRELVLAEVELPDAQAPSPVPAWLAPWVVREVTEEETYVNLNLAR